MGAESRRATNNRAQPLADVHLRRQEAALTFVQGSGQVDSTPVDEEALIGRGFLGSIKPTRRRRGSL